MIEPDMKLCNNTINSYYALHYNNPFMYLQTKRHNTTIRSEIDIFPCFAISHNPVYEPFHFGFRGTP